MQPDKVREIMNKGVCSEFKNDCGLVSKKYTNVIKGSVPEPQPQHRLDPNCMEEIGHTIKK